MMTVSGLRRAVARLRRLTGGPSADEPSDGQLLARFAKSRDEAAFSELVARHGPLVQGVGRRVLGPSDAADDVFQATFLVLARKADSVTWRADVGSWLHAAAHRLALKARSARHATAPLPDTPAPDSDPSAPLTWQEVRTALDEELLRLPERLRAPLVLCYLEGQTRDEAARRLGCSLAKLKRRLERGRNLLRDRLTRRGFALAAAGWAAALIEATVSAAVARETARAAAGYVTAGIVPDAVAALLANSTEPVWSRARAALTLLALGLGAGTATLTIPRPNAIFKTTPPPINPPAAGHVDLFGDPLPEGAVARFGSARLRPTGPVTHLAFAPDGQRLATYSGELSIWDAATGRELRRGTLPGRLAALA